MTPETEETIRRWRTTIPDPEKKQYPEWLLTCRCVGCRKNRTELGIAEKGEE